VTPERRGEGLAFDQFDCRRKGEQLADGNFLSSPSPRKERSKKGKDREKKPYEFLLDVRKGKRKNCCSLPFIPFFFTRRGERRRREGGVEGGNRDPSLHYFSLITREKGGPCSNLLRLHRAQRAKRGASLHARRSRDQIRFSSRGGGEVSIFSDREKRTVDGDFWGRGEKGRDVEETS